jgi:hypothetical protein
MQKGGIASLVVNDLNRRRLKNLRIGQFDPAIAGVTKRAACHRGKRLPMKSKSGSVLGQSPRDSGLFMTFWPTCHSPVLLENGRNTAC